MADQREPGWARPVVLPSSWSAATADAQGTAHCHMCFCVPCLHVLRFEGRNGNTSSFLLKFSGQRNEDGDVWLLWTAVQAASSLACLCPWAQPLGQSSRCQHEIGLDFVPNKGCCSRWPSTCLFLSQTGFVTKVRLEVWAVGVRPQGVPAASGLCPVIRAATLHA